MLHHRNPSVIGFGHVAGTFGFTDIVKLQLLEFVVL